MTEPRIVRFEYQMPRAKPAFADPMPTVVATFDDGARKEPFSFYPGRDDQSHPTPGAHKTDAGSEAEVCPTAAMSLKP
jgi:hypothetical protein